MLAAFARGSPQEIVSPGNSGGSAWAPRDRRFDPRPRSAADPLLASQGAGEDDEEEEGGDGERSEAHSSPSVGEVQRRMGKKAAGSGRNGQQEQRERCQGEEEAWCGEAIHPLVRRRDDRRGRNARNAARRRADDGL